MTKLWTGNDVCDAYLGVLQEDTVLVDIFKDGFFNEDPGGVTPKQDKLMAVTLMAEGHDDGSTGGSTFVNLYQVAIIVYVTDKEKDPLRKRELVEITGIMKQSVMRQHYRSDPDRGRAAWYKSGFAQPVGTRYRTWPNHRQSITVIELRNRKRTLI